MLWVSRNTRRVATGKQIGNLLLKQNSQKKGLLKHANFEYLAMTGSAFGHKNRVFQGITNAGLRQFS